MTQHILSMALGAFALFAFMLLGSATYTAEVWRYAGSAISAATTLLGLLGLYLLITGIAGVWP